MEGRQVQIGLRPVEPEDLDEFFMHQQDAEARQMAAFTSDDPTDRLAFDAHWARLLNDQAIVVRTIVAIAGRTNHPERSAIAGHIIRFPQEGQLEVTYWIDRDWWNLGIATAALRRLLVELPERPVTARVAADNTASIRVLEKLGFRVAERTSGYAAAREREIDELLLQLN
jgi:RimJ/RimL family protein N-acetyltransferase